MDPTIPSRAGIGRSSFLTIWALGAGSVGQEEDISQGAERSVQIDGELDGASVLIEGSNDGTHYHALCTHDGLFLAFKQTGFSGVRELCRMIRPRVEGGGPSTKLTIALLVRVGR